MCDLLRHRGQGAAALVVAASELTSDCVDNWDGGQYEVTLAVPAVMYDGACTEAVKAELTAAAEAVVTWHPHWRNTTTPARSSDE